MIQKQISEMDPKQAKHCLYYSTPIDSILPECIIQYILSFNQSKDINSIFAPISKSFKKYTQKNEEMYIKQLESIENISITPWDKTHELEYLRMTNKINEISQRRIKLQNQNSNNNAYEIKSLYSTLINFENRLNKMRREIYSYRMARSQLNKNSQTILIDNNNKSTNNIWIIDKNRDELSSQEMKLFCNGPFANFEQVMNEIKNGDRIYVYNDFDIGNEIPKSVEIIGISNNNKLINCNINGTVYVTHKANVFFEN
eukprot:478343_1